MGMILPLIYLVAGLTLALTLPEHRGRQLKEWASALLTRWIIPAVIIYTVATSRPELFFVAASTMVMMLLGVLGAGRITRRSRAEARLRVPKRRALRHPRGRGHLGR